ncbi:FliM/FliN family flagellar motor switch protein [Dyella acidisoli]|nr:FliM/FliN family flagellar motor switch protein [Dyella acidisoli]
MDHAPIPGDTSEALREAARALLARGNTLLQSVHGTLELRAGVGHQGHAAALPCVALDSAQGRLRVALEREQVASPLGDAHWQDYAGEARLLAWSLAHELMLNALGHVFGGGFVATGFLPACTDVECLWLVLSWRDENDQWLQGWLGLGPTEARQLTASADWKRDPAKLAMLGDAAMLTLDLALQGAALDSATVSELALGDVLLVSDGADCNARLQPDQDTSRRMFGLPSGWAVQRRQGQWTIAAKPLLSTAVDAHRPQFRLTQLSLSPEEAGALQPGSVLSYDTALLGNTVDIVLGGHRFGDGVLVALGEWLGVRITHKDPMYNKGSTRGFQ